MKKVTIIIACLVAVTVTLLLLVRFRAVPDPGLVSTKSGPQPASAQHNSDRAQTSAPTNVERPTPPEFKIPSDPLLVAVENQSPDGDLLLIGLLAPGVPAENVASPNSDENGASYYFAVTHFLPGKRYKLYRGGSAAGEAVITGTVSRQCDARGATAKAEPEMNLGREGFALATNSPQIVTHANHQREPTQSETTAALQAARKIFSEKGVLPEDLRHIVLQSLVATVVDRAGSRILIGWFQIMTPTAGHKLFVIVGGAEDAPQTQYAEYETLLRKDMVAEGEEWPGRPLQNFVDQLDLDGDGVDELVTESVGYEGGDYIIYKRQNNRWFQVFRGGEGGC